MKNYELLAILKSAKDEESPEIVSCVTEIIKKNNGKILNEENWGKRPTAYPIKKETKGVFCKVSFTAEAEAIKNIEGACRLHSEILRTMIIKRDK